MQIAQKTNSATIDLCLDTIGRQKQALVFVNTKRSAEKTAEEIATKLPWDKGTMETARQVLTALSMPTRQCRRLSECLKKGVAFHHAGLTHKQKELIEDSFRKREIKIICCTPTLAMGIDVPAFRTILKDVKRFGIHGLSFIPVLEYLQMSGRAGRPKFDSYGESILIASSKLAKKRLCEIYVNGEPEDVYSKLAVEPVLRMYLLSLIASDFVNQKDEIMDFFQRTFWAYQFRDTKKLEKIIDKILHLLEEWKFIKSDKEEFVSAAEMKNNNYEATLLGKRVAELYVDPLTAYQLVLAIMNSTKKKISDFSFVQVISHTLEMRPLLRPRVKEFDLLQEELAKHEAILLEQEPSMYEEEYDDFMKSIKTALFFMDWINEKDEEFLLEQYNVRPGEIRAKLDIADWLLYAVDEISRILSAKKILKDVAKLRFRVKYGVKEELLPLLKLKNVGRVRARKLYRNGIKTINDVSKADLMKLVQILGRNTAINVKKQVGIEIKEVPKGKRKGQVSIDKFTTEK